MQPWREERFAVHLPVQVRGLDADGNHFRLDTSTLDISRRGARLDHITCLKHPGDIVQVQGGHGKTFFRVVWIGTPETPRVGQIGLCSLTPRRPIWGTALPAPAPAPAPAHFPRVSAPQPPAPLPPKPILPEETMTESTEDPIGAQDAFDYDNELIPPTPPLWRRPLYVIPAAALLVFALSYVFFPARPAPDGQAQAAANPAGSQPSAPSAAPVIPLSPSPVTASQPATMPEPKATEPVAASTTAAATTTVASRATTATAAPTRSRLAVQVGAYEERSTAEALARRLSTRYRHTALVAPLEVKGKTLYRVRLSVANKTEANQLAVRLRKNEKLEAWVVHAD